MEDWKVMYEMYPLYEVSSIGNVRRVGTNVILKQRTGSDGFAMVLLRDKNDTRKWVNVNDIINMYFEISELLF